MKKITIALLAACSILAACKSSEPKPEENIVAPTSATTQTEATPAPTKPECKPEPVAKKGAKKSKKSTKKANPAPVDCEPAKPKADQAANSRMIATKPGAAAAPAGEANSK